MKKYDCWVNLGGFRQTALSDNADLYSIEKAVRQDSEEYMRNDPDSHLDINIRVDCEEIGEGTPDRFDDEYEEGIWIQR